MKIMTSFCMLLWVVTTSGQSGNIGSGITTPSSRLTIKNFFAAGFNIVITPTYTLTDSNYFVKYSGATAGTFTLPTATTGNVNFAGRIYRIKKNVIPMLTLQAAAGEKISHFSGISIASVSVAEVISTGAATGTTWEVMNIFRPAGCR